MEDLLHDSIAPDSLTKYKKTNKHWSTELAGYSERDTMVVTFKIQNKVGGEGRGGGACLLAQTEGAGDGGGETEVREKEGKDRALGGEVGGCGCSTKKRAREGDIHQGEDSST